MYTLRAARERGCTELDWLESRHTFSFAEYYDPEVMGFGDLRVINDDIVAPGTGFGMHPHRDMEIISIVLSGALEHKDSIGSGSVIRPGDVQIMTAGSGIMHSEFNPSQTEPVHFLQIWILTNRKDHPPAYEQKAFKAEEMKNAMCLVVSGTGEDGSLKINQDLRLYQAILEKDAKVSYKITKDRKYWIQVASGKIAVNDQILDEGDGLAILDEENRLEFTGLEDGSNFIFFDLRT